MKVMKIMKVVKIILKSDFFWESSFSWHSLNSCLWHRDSVKQVISEVCVGGAPGDRGRGAVHPGVGDKGMHCLQLI